MDVMDEELLEFWRTLNEYQVKFMMIGGLATRFYGYNRTTDDLDMWIKDSVENRRNLRKAFAALAYGDFPEIETMQFVPGWTSFHAAGIVLDIITEMRGLEHLSFDDSYNMANMVTIEDVIVPFIHLSHLIQNKKAIYRTKDKIDVEYLEKIKQFKKNDDSI